MSNILNRANHAGVARLHAHATDLQGKLDPDNSESIVAFKLAAARAYIAMHDCAEPVEPWLAGEVEYSFEQAGIARTRKRAMLFAGAPAASRRHV